MRLIDGDALFNELRKAQRECEKDGEELGGESVLIAVGLEDACEIVKGAPTFNQAKQGSQEKATCTAETQSHSEAAILRGCISLMQTLTNRFMEYLDFMDLHPENSEERFGTSFYMTEIVERLFLWETRHSGGTSQHLKLEELGVEEETVTFEDGREAED